MDVLHSLIDYRAGPETQRLNITGSWLRLPSKSLHNRGVNKPAISSNYLEEVKY